jgi:hypothetical protein
MARDTAGAQRVDYGNKSGEEGHDKLLSSKSAGMTKGGAANSDGSGGPTGSKRNYPKGSSVSMSADFNPMRDKKRGATDWAVGGV